MLPAFLMKAGVTEIYVLEKGSGEKQSERSCVATCVPLKDTDEAAHPLNMEAAPSHIFAAPFNQ